MSFTAIFEQWTLVEGSFHTVFGVDLETAWRVKSWRWFTTRLTFLLQTENPLQRFFLNEKNTEATDA